MAPKQKPVEWSDSSGSELYKSNGGNSWTHVGRVDDELPALGGKGGLYSSADFKVGARSKLYASAS